jgi:hypothetical protein
MEASFIRRQPCDVQICNHTSFPNLITRQNEFKLPPQLYLSSPKAFSHCRTPFLTLAAEVILTEPATNLRSENVDTNPLSWCQAQTVPATFLATPVDMDRPCHEHRNQAGSLGGHLPINYEQRQAQIFENTGLFLPLHDIKMLALSILGSLLVRMRFYHQPEHQTCIVRRVIVLGDESLGLTILQLYMDMSRLWLGFTIFCDSL